MVIFRSLEALKRLFQISEVIINNIHKNVHSYKINIELIIFFADNKQGNEVYSQLVRGIPFVLPILSPFMNQSLF